jgi:PKD repeat protein
VATLSGSRAYDGTTNATAAILTVANKVSGDDVSLASGSGGLASKNVGARALTSVGSLALGGADAVNYTLTGASGSVTINPLAVQLTGSRPYDGTTNAAAGILSVANKVGSDDVTVASGTGGLAGSDVGTQALTSFGDLALGGAAAGNYTLTGASGSVTIAPLAPVADFSASPTNGTAPLSVSFTNLSTGATNYAWTFGDGNTSALTNPANTYTNPGTYSVTLTAVGPGGTNALTRTNYILATLPSSVTMTIEKIGDNVVVNWPQGTLLEAPDLTGPWTTNNAASPYTNAPAGAAKFYRVRVQ